jgi:hypothetical protein
MPFTSTEYALVKTMWRRWKFSSILKTESFPAEFTLARKFVAAEMGGFR